MRESDTYQAILDEGRVEQAKKLLLRLGKKLLGAPGKTDKALLAAIMDLKKRLERLHDHVGDVKTWQELLAIR